MYYKWAKIKYFDQDIEKTTFKMLPLLGCLTISLENLHKALFAIGGPWLFFQVKLILKYSILRSERFLGN